MSQPPQEALQRLLDLAKEYQSKQKELDQWASQASPEELRPGLMAFGERAADRFRAAQQVLLFHLYSDEAAPSEEVREAAAAMCRCFDEVLLLFHRLLDEGASRA